MIDLFEQNYAKRAVFNLFPFWLIADDPFIIFNHLFAASIVVDKLRKNNKINVLFFLNFFSPCAHLLWRE